MKVTVADGWQVKHGGKNYVGGDSFDATESEGKKLIAAGLVTAAKSTPAKATTSSKNKATTSSKNKATTSSKNKAG